MALNLNNLIYTSTDYKIALSIPGGVTAPLNSVESYGYEAKVEDETIYAIGQDEPIGEKQNAAQYSGKLSLQAGELQALLAASGLVLGTQIKGATLSIVTFAGDLLHVWKSVNVISQSGDVKAKDKQTLVNLTWKAVGVAGI